MSKELAKTYDPKAIEEKLYERWCENKYFHAEVDRSKKPFTTVMLPPNITGSISHGKMKARWTMWKINCMTQRWIVGFVMRSSLRTQSGYAHNLQKRKMKSWRCA